MMDHYAHNNHHEWVESVTKQKCSDLGKQVANILGFVGRGIYNAPINVEKIKWADDLHIQVIWRGEMSNYDFLTLSLLWVECHRRMLRVTISGCAPNTLRLQFWQRHKREGMIGERLPDCEEMILMIDKAWNRNDKQSQAA